MPAVLLLKYSVLVASESTSIAFVTGASSGIGQAIAQRLANDGFFVLAHFHSQKEKMNTIVEEIRNRGGKAEAIGFDVQNSSDLETKLDQWIAEHPGLHLEAVVNSAGRHEDTLAGLMSDEAFDRVVKTNLYGSFYVMRWALRKMLRQRKGCIVNLASVAGQVGNPGQINYAASKAGVIAMTKTLAMELGARGIRVNAVAPGLIETPMIQDIPHPEKIIERIPLGRMGRADEVASAVSFLCSSEASYITGHTLSVNGGLFPS